MAKIIKLKRSLKENISSPVILYDGVCNFCNAVVNFVISKDETKVFLFAPIQSREARMLLRSLNEPFVNLKTVYLIDQGKVYKKSEAIFHIMKKLPYPWKALAAMGILPVFLTDKCYAFIAKNRYKWFGKSEEVIKPHEKVKERFLTGS
jgi:predicted DCC family thiol-disulfide oxidoreductase YuxK